VPRSHARYSPWYAAGPETTSDSKEGVGRCRSPVSRASLVAPGYYDEPRLSPGLPKPGMSREDPAIPRRGPVPRSRELLKRGSELSLRSSRSSSARIATSESRG